MKDASMRDDYAPSGSDVAIIGMAGRFPGARNVSELWRNLRGGVESVKRFTDEELLAAGEAPEALSDPAYVKAWPVLADIERYDAGFFGHSPRDAAIMDPQHRFFLETAWEALESAGYVGAAYPGLVGVFAACGMNTYMMHHLVTNLEVMETVGEWLVRHTANDMNFLATRVSYELDLKGPSMNVQTACSSALVAVHVAAQSLLSGECDLALAGASAMSLPQDRGYLYREGEILSPDGHCRAFDAGARGTLFGSGTGCVVLKRLGDALADGDEVLAVLRGSAINNDGSAKVGYLAPSVEGQAKVVAEALAIAGVSAETISYVEAHGTGTRIGDPIEVAALTQAYRASTARKGYCAIGSAKPNIGHLGEAAGVAGLIKTVLSLKHKELPPSLSYASPNPQIDFPSTPFYVNAKLCEWPASGGPRRAGVTALGAGGTNVHVILEEAPLAAPSGPSRPRELLVLSAKTQSALDAATTNLARHLRESPAQDLADVAYTLQLGRKAFAHRRTLVCRDREEAMVALETRDPARVASGLHERGAPSIVFMFPGGGAQYAGMGADLYASEPVYRQVIDDCAERIQPELGLDLRTLLFPAPAAAALATRGLERPSLALPALFATSLATAKLLMSWGIEPAAMIGHSAGEIVAACLAGVLSPDDGMGLVALRGRLFETLPEGAMLSVALTPDDARAYLSADLSLAAINAPGLCVASGPVASIARMEEALRAKEIECARIHIGVAAHSSMLDPILAAIEARCQRIRFEPPARPYVSNLTGTWITEAEAVDPTYWARHLRSTVRFAEGIGTILEHPGRVLVEIGPGRTLSSLGRQQPSKPSTSLSTLRHPKEEGLDVAFLLDAIGKLWLAGADVDWKRFHEGESRRRVPLPTYPFEQQRFWIERGDRTAAPKAKPPSLRKRADVAEWFHLPSWRRSLAPAQGAAEPIVDPGSFAAYLPRLCRQRRSRGAPRAAARRERDRHRLPGPRVRADRRPRVHPRSRRARRLRRPPLRPPGARPHAATDRPPVGGDGAEPGLGDRRAPAGGGPRRVREAAGALLLQPALPGAGSHHAPRSDRAHDCVEQPPAGRGRGGARSREGDAPRTLPGDPPRAPPRRDPLRRRRAPRERIMARGAPPRAARRRALRAAEDSVIAYRGVDRWIQTFDPVRLGPAQASWVRPGGVYLITGGLGGLGLELAEHIAKGARAKLVLVGRSALPARSTWASFLAAHDAENGTCRKIRRIEALEALGSDVMTASADVTELEQMEKVVADAKRRFGAIHGVVHAAGTLNDVLIELRPPDAASPVLATKVKGALVLDALLHDARLDFFVLFSSVSSILGLPGQIDYTAANAFLDAFARYLTARGRTHVISINWSAWQEVGMAAALSTQRARPRAPDVKPGAHPLFERCADRGDSVVFSTDFSRAKQWIVAEHVVRGAEALMPGTGYLELARAALGQTADARAVEIRDAVFLAPFALHRAETRELHVKLSRASHEIVVFSRSEAEPHMTGKVAYAEVPPARSHDVAAIAARCTERDDPSDGFLPQSFMDFGPRWGNVRRIRRGRGEALLSLELPEAFAGDSAQYRLHPALLDMATGGAQALLPAFDSERHFSDVPFSYGRLLLRGGLPARLHSHVRLREGSAKDSSVSST